MSLFLALAPLLGGCSALDDPDLLLAGATSPDGRRTARIWCENFCDVTGRATLTVSPAELELELKRDGDWTMGRLPEANRAGEFFGDEQNAAWAVTWEGPSTVLVAGRCIVEAKPEKAAGLTIRWATTATECS